MRSDSFKSWFFLFLLALIWGSSFILMKLSMYDANGDSIFTDPQVASLRMLIASVCLLPFAARAFRKVKSIKSWIMLSLVGFCGNFFPAFLFTYSETGISSGYAGMLNSFTPIFALILGFIVFSQRLNRIQMLGVGIGLVGVILLMLAGRDLEIKGDLTHVLAVVLATFFYAVSLNVIKHTLHGLKGIEITSLSFLIIFLPSLIISYFNGSFVAIEIQSNATEGLIPLTILSVVGTAFAVIIFNYLIAMTSVLFASSVTYLIPVVAVLIGVTIGEQISWGQVLSMAIVLLGVFISNVLSKKVKA